MSCITGRSRRFGGSPPAITVIVAGARHPGPPETGASTSPCRCGGVAARRCPGGIGIDSRMVDQHLAGPAAAATPCPSTPKRNSPPPRHRARTSGRYRSAPRPPPAMPRGCAPPPGLRGQTVGREVPPARLQPRVVGESAIASPMMPTPTRPNRCPVAIARLHCAPLASWLRCERRADLSNPLCSRTRVQTHKIHHTIAATRQAAPRSFSRQLVVAGGDSPEVLNPANRVLDTVSALIGLLY